MEQRPDFNIDQLQQMFDKMGFTLLASGNALETILAHLDKASPSVTFAYPQADSDGTIYTITLEPSFGEWSVQRVAMAKAIASEDPDINPGIYYKMYGEHWYINDKAALMKALDGSAKSVFLKLTDNSIFLT